MISPIDIFCLALFAGLMVLEAHRGVLPALLDFVCVLVAIVLTRWAYVPLSEHMQPSSAYMLLIGVAVLLTVILSIYVSSRLQVQVTPVESAMAAGLGLGTAILLSYAIFDWLAVRYGGGAVMANNSLLYWAMTEAAGLRELADFFRKLTRG